MERKQFPSLVALMHGVYYIFTGVWPIVSRQTFEAITGPKVDFWLVKTTGALIAGVGAVLALAGLRNQVSPETALLSISSAASLAGSDVIYSTRWRIPKVYLLESTAEFGLIGLWLISLVLYRRSKRASVLKLPFK